MRTSDQLQIHGARLLREHGLTPLQHNVLRILRGEGKSLPILEIASRTITVVPGITVVPVQATVPSEVLLFDLA